MDPPSLVLKDTKRQNDVIRYIGQLHVDDLLVDRVRKTFAQEMDTGMRHGLDKVQQLYHDITILDNGHAEVATHYVTVECTDGDNIRHGTV